MRILALLAAIPALALAVEPPVEYEQYTPEWFYSLAFVDARPNLARRGMERFFQRDFAGASGLAVGSGVRVADQALANGSVEMAKGAEWILEGKEDSAVSALSRCVEYATEAVVLAEDEPQNLRGSVLKARCLALIPDRTGAAQALARTAEQLSDPADAAEFLFGAARLQEDMGRFDTAYSLYQKSWNLDPQGDFGALSLQSSALMQGKVGNWQGIFPIIEQINRLYTGDLGLRVRMQILEGQALIQLGDTTKGTFRWKQLTNSFVNRSGDLIPDSVEAAEVYWRMGDLAANRAATLRFDGATATIRRANHIQRREIMEDAFGYYRQAVACYSYPWTPLALRDIAGVIERYAQDVARQRLDFANDTDRVALEVLVQKKLPNLFQSAAATYRRQIRLAQSSGDGIGIGLQSGNGLARSWWNSVQARRTAMELLQGSPRPAGDSAGLAYYNKVLDSAIQAEFGAAKKSALDGLTDLSQWNQLNWPEADSLAAFVGNSEAQRAIAKGVTNRTRPENIELIPQETPVTALQWYWRALEARRLARNTVLDIRLMKARLAGK